MDKDKFAQLRGENDAVIVATGGTKSRFFPWEGAERLTMGLEYLKAINRGHDFACTQRAIHATAERGLPVGGHLILGLPGESRANLLAEMDLINALPLTTVKFHQLQILHGTTMELQYQDEAFRQSLLQFTLEEYITLVCDLLERLRPDLVVERLAGEVPPRYQACPERSFRRKDGRLMRNEEIPALVEAELERRGSRQGSKVENSFFPTLDAVII